MSSNIAKFMAEHGFNLKATSVLAAETSFYFENVEEAQRAWEYFTSSDMVIKVPELDGWYYGLEEMQELEYALGDESQITWYN